MRVNDAKAQLLVEADDSYLPYLYEVSESAGARVEAQAHSPLRSPIEALPAVAYYGIVGVLSVRTLTVLAVDVADRLRGGIVINLRGDSSAFVVRTRVVPHGMIIVQTV